MARLVIILSVSLVVLSIFSISMALQYDDLLERYGYAMELLDYFMSQNNEIKKEIESQKLGLI